MRSTENFPFRVKISEVYQLKGDSQGIQKEDISLNANDITCDVLLFSTNGLSFFGFPGKILNLNR